VANSLRSWRYEAPPGNARRPTGGNAIHGRALDRAFSAEKCASQYVQEIYSAAAGRAHAANEFYVIEGAGDTYGMAGAEKSIATVIYNYAG
jgi:hypothetical protein